MSEALSTQAVAALGQERLERRLGARAPGAARARARRARRRAARRRASDVCRISRCSGGRPPAAARALMSGSASATDWPAGRASSARELDAARGSARRRGRRRGRCRSAARRGARRRAGRRRAARRAARGRPRAASRRARRAPPRGPPTSAPSAARASSANGDGGCSAPRSERRGVGEHEPLARARHRDVQQAAHLGDVRLARVGRQLAPCSSASGIGSTSRRRAPGIRADCRPRTKTWSNSQPVAACIASTRDARRARRGVGRRRRPRRSPASATAASERANSRGVGLRAAAHVVARRARRAARG